MATKCNKYIYSITVFMSDKKAVCISDGAIKSF